MDVYCCHIPGRHVLPLQGSSSRLKPSNLRHQTSNHAFLMKLANQQFEPAKADPQAYLVVDIFFANLTSIRGVFENSLYVGSTRRQETVSQRIQRFGRALCLRDENSSRQRRQDVTPKIARDRSYTVQGRPEDIQCPERVLKRAVRPYKSR